MRTCTKCSAEIRKGDKYSHTKRGDHHNDCVSAAMARCGARLTKVDPLRWVLGCRENNNLIRWSEDRHNFTDKLKGEFHIADELGKSWIVIGLDDVLEALRLVGIKVQR